MKKEECRNETKRTTSGAAFSSFIIPPSAFEMSLVTPAAAREAVLNETMIAAQVVCGGKK
jgi:hypothetical protein